MKDKLEPTPEPDFENKLNEVWPTDTLYQPSNGTEGHHFTAAWCMNCALRKPDRENEIDIGCQIYENTLFFSPGDKEYPPQWIRRDGEPMCTAFKTPEQQRQEDYMADKERLERSGQGRLF